MVLPEVRHLVNEGREDLLRIPTLEGRRIQCDLVNGPILAVIELRHALGDEVAEGPLVPLQGDDATGQQPAEQMPVGVLVSRVQARSPHGRMGRLPCLSSLMGGPRVYRTIQSERPARAGPGRASRSFQRSAGGGPHFGPPDLFEPSPLTGGPSVEVPLLAPGPGRSRNASARGVGGQGSVSGS